VVLREMTVELGLFYALATLTLSSALGVILARDTESAVLALGVGAASLAGVFAVLGAYFLAVAQLWIGFAALLALLVFGRTLAAVERAGLGPRDPGRVVIKTVGVVLAVALGVTLVRVVVQETAWPSDARVGGASLGDPGLELTTLFVVPLLVLGLLLLAALLGAAVFLRRNAR